MFLAEDYLREVAVLLFSYISLLFEMSEVRFVSNKSTHNQLDYGDFSFVLYSNDKNKFSIQMPDPYYCKTAPLACPKPF